MKPLFLPLLLLFAFSTAKAQNPLTNKSVTDTFPYMTEHHSSRLAIFNAEPKNTGKLLFLGNSITEGGNWKDLLGDDSAINRGIGGDITFGTLKRLDEVIGRKPSKLFLLIGINDIGMDIPEVIIADNVRKIIERLQSETPNTKIYLQSILPVNPEYPRFPQHYDKQEHVMLTNQLLSKVAISSGVTFVNLFPLFLDSKNRLDAELTVDGLHLNRKGYELWVNHLKKMGYL